MARETTMRAAVWLLGLAVVATILGQTLAVFRGDGSSINSFLFLDLGYPDFAAARAERIALVAISFLALLSLAWPRWFLLVPVFLYLLLEAVAGYHMRGYAFSEWTPAAHALRFLTPLALVLIARGVAARSSGSPSPTALSGGGWLLKLGLAAVFCSHGYEAFQRHPAFIDLIITTGQNLLGVRIEESAAAAALRVIGAVDIAAAVLLLIRPWRPVLVWMLFWGLLTAVSRMTSYGLGAYTDILVRTTHFAAPLALLWIVPSQRPRCGDAQFPATETPATVGAATIRPCETVLDGSPTAG